MLPALFFFLMIKNSVCGVILGVAKFGIEPRIYYLYIALLRKKIVRVKEIPYDQGLFLASLLRAPSLGFDIRELLFT